MPQRVRRDDFADAGAARGVADDPPGTMPVQPPPVRGQEHRPAGPFPDGQVDRPGRARGQRKGDHLAPFAGDRQGPVPAFQAEVLDVRSGGFRDPQPIQREQGDQRVLGRRPEPGGDQQADKLVPVERDGMGLVVHPRTADVRGG